jgi:hypothetical protein
MPMEIFTPDELRPSEKTLEFLRHFAHIYRVGKHNRIESIYCLN